MVFDFDDNRGGKPEGGAERAKGRTTVIAKESMCVREAVARERSRAPRSKWRLAQKANNVWVALGRIWSQSGVDAKSSRRPDGQVKSRCRRMRRVRGGARQCSMVAYNREGYVDQQRVYAIEWVEVCV